MKILFASYKTSHGFGNCTIELDDEKTIENISDIEELQSKIKKAKNLNDVVIENMIMLPIK